MKKLLCGVVVGVLCIGLLISGAPAEEFEVSGVISTAPDGVQEGSELIVGTTTPMDGHFGTDLWGDNTSDMDARLLLHDYATIDKDMTPGIGTHGIAVKDMTAQEQSDGSRVYTFTIEDGLTYNDGTPIDARDYVFSLLLSASKELKAVGGMPSPMDHIRGFESYNTGESAAFSGVRLLSAKQFSIQVEAGYAPYFYELTLLSTGPYPITVIAPGCEVVDDGDGAYLRKGSGADSIQGMPFTPGEFSAEMLRETMLNEETGYEFYPMVTSGPYQLLSYNRENKTAVFGVNPAFKGNYQGQMPHIEKIVFRTVSNETMFEEMQRGNLDLINKVASRSALVTAQEVVTNDPGVSGVAYLRSGMTFLSFACESGPTASEAVRKAIAMSMDKDTLVTEMMGGVAMRVYGYYGVGQWMAVYTEFQNGDQTVLETLKKLDIPQDIEYAKELLESDGWALDAQGNPYESGTRYRQGADGLESLTIKWVRPTENGNTEAVEKALREGLTAIGAALEATDIPFDEMLKHYYRETDRTYDMFLLATNFGYVFDPYYDFNTADMYQGSVNKTGLRDEKLEALAKEMRMTAPSDLNGYMERWFAFQERFVQVLPLIPLYSGVYMDVASDALQGYDIMVHSSWARAVLYAWIDR